MFPSNWQIKDSTLLWYELCAGLSTEGEVGGGVPPPPSKSFPGNCPPEK